MKTRASECSNIWLLVAYKSAGRGLSIMSGKDLNAFNFTEISKVGSQFFHTKLGREVLNEEVALLFRVLKSLLLS
jgi:hypothetical protein